MGAAWCCIALAELAWGNEIETYLSQLRIAAAACVEHTAPAGPALLHCISVKAPGPNWWLPRPVFDEALRNASCRAASGSDAIEHRSWCASEVGDFEFSVEIFRKHPIVALVKRFATMADCEMLLQEVNGLPVAPAKASGATEGFIRRSRSKNMNWENVTENLKHFQSKMFAVTRHLTNYAISLSSPEPLNIAAYSEPGDEYRAHCDGRCGGSRHQVGERVATSIIYCQVADVGGHVTFTAQHLKLVPEAGDMLVFGHLDDDRMSRQVEHSACPVWKGQKWIATQWYRSLIIGLHR
eukprot:symbB.v1.2.000573.t1/scaffold3.1/size669525/13